METLEVRMARLEEGMVSVKGDTAYLRRGFDDFKHRHWQELLKIGGRVIVVAGVVGLVAGLAAVFVAQVFL